MEWYEWVVDGLGVLCTITSFISAIKSAIYYKKSKNISQLCNNIVALNEMENLRNLITELVGFSNPANTKGKRVLKIVSEIGNKMLSSVQCIEKNTDTNNWGKLRSFFGDKNFDIYSYLNKIISGEKTARDEVVSYFIKDDDFGIFQQGVNYFYNLIKQSIENNKDELK